MRKQRYLSQWIPRILLLIMLMVTVHGVYDNAHATHDSVGSAGHSAITMGCGALPGELPGDQPTHQHSDYDGCDNCINCLCHAPLPAQQVVLTYQQTTGNISIFSPYQFLPEVYLSKFIPPQNHA